MHADKLYARLAFKHGTVHPVRLLDARMWREVSPGGDTRYHLEDVLRVTRPTAFVGMLVVKHTALTGGTLTVGERMAAELAELPRLELALEHTPASDEAARAELDGRVATYQACLPAGLRLAVIDPRTVRSPWIDWVRKQHKAAGQLAALTKVHDAGYAAAVPAEPVPAERRPVNRMHDALDTITSVTGVHLMSGGVDLAGPYATLRLDEAEALAAWLGDRS